LRWTNLTGSVEIAPESTQTDPEADLENRRYINLRYYEFDRAM